MIVEDFVMLGTTVPEPRGACLVNADDTLQRLCAALSELRDDFDANAAAEYLGGQVADMLDGVLIEALLADATGRAS